MLALCQMITLMIHRTHRKKGASVVVGLKKMVCRFWKASWRCQAPIVFGEGAMVANYPRSISLIRRSLASDQILV